MCSILEFILMDDIVENESSWNVYNASKNNANNMQGIIQAPYDDSVEATSCSD